MGLVAGRRISVMYASSTGVRPLWGVQAPRLGLMPMQRYYGTMKGTPRIMSKPKVSVIIPTYNRERFIAEAVDSVLAQTYKNIEIIVVDDGSTDNTKEVLEPYMDWITYLPIENGGPARARNAGMQAATGDYIAFLDSDDVYEPYKVEVQARLLDTIEEVGLVCSELSAIDDNGNMLDEFHLKKYHRAAYLKEDSAYERIYSKSITIAQAGFDIKDWGKRRVYVGDVFDRYYDELIISTNTVMFRREVIDSVGLQHEPYWLFEDYEFVLRITRSHQVAFIDIPTYRLRYHDAQISTTRNKPDGLEILFKKHTTLIEIAERHGLHDSDYYQRNKAAVDKKMACLNKAVAVELMKSGRDSKRARIHLKNCSHYSRPLYFLWLLTIAPMPLKKLYFKLASVADLIHMG